MKKLIITFVLCMALALMPVAHAAMPTIGVTITPIDYLYAQAGIAQPVSKGYVANERYALLVTVSVPNFMDVSAMSVRIEPYGCTVETGTVPIAAGQYILTGTVLSAGANIKVTMQDERLSMAGTAQELWQAMYGDRTVSVTHSFGGGSSNIGVYPSIPQTGEPGLALALIGCSLPGLILLRRRFK